MPGYVDKVLLKFQHPTPSKPQQTPYHVPASRPFRSSTRQYAPSPDTSPSLNATGVTRVQSIIGSLLYYARALDCTILPALNTISSQQASPTDTTLHHCHTLLDYVASHPNTILRFHASDMLLAIDSDAAYLVAPQARSRVAGYFQLNSLPDTVNGALLVECKTLRHVVASSAEAETACIFYNAQVAVPLRYMLEQLGHPQPPTKIKTDNATASGFVHANITQKRSKSWDMRYHWLRDKSQQSQFAIYLDSAVKNLADYFTKHHTAKHHQSMRPQYVIDRD